VRIRRQLHGLIRPRALLLALCLAPGLTPLTSAGSAAAAAETPSPSGHQAGHGAGHGAAELRTRFEQLGAKPSELPVHVESEHEQGHLRCDVYSIVEQRIDTVRDALTLPANWCEILPLQFNVKSCTYGERGRESLLTLYLGRKFFQEPEAAHRLELSFEVPRSGPDGFEIALRGEEGPLGTRNHRLTLAGIPLAGEQTLIHLGYSQDHGLMSRVAMFSYLKTLGRGKVGFTVVGRNSEGGPIYVRGLRGMIERNAMRYHLSVQAFLDTLDVSEPRRFERRIERWFDLISAHPEQLFEMERDEYLRSKRAERGNQSRLQGAL
jgi:hypothetical protein